MVKKCRSCGKNRLIEFFFKQFMGKRGALTADRCLLDSNPESKRGEAPAAPGFYRSCASRRTMGSAHRRGCLVFYSAERNYKTHRREAAIPPP